MTETDKIAWGKAEQAARIHDVQMWKAGFMTLVQAQRDATQRQRQAGLTPTEAARYLRKARIA